MDRQASGGADGAPLICHKCHGAEQTTLYRWVQLRDASFIAHTEANTGAGLPRSIEDAPAADRPNRRAAQVHIRHHARDDTVLEVRQIHRCGADGHRGPPERADDA